MNIYGIFRDNPSARAIINHAYTKARQSKFETYWSAKLTELTGIDGDMRTGQDTGHDPEPIHD